VAIDEETARDIQKLDFSAYERTRAAYERTMLAWVRTATSLITFGFSIYKFFQLATTAHPPEHQRLGSRAFALLLVCIGLLSLALATLDYRRNLRVLTAPRRGRHHRSLAVAVAGMVSVAGIFALLVMIVRA
jgi:putative membrane protein